MGAAGSRQSLRRLERSRVPAEERDRIKASWWDAQTAADYLSISKRHLDRKLANGSLPDGVCEDIDGVRYYNPEALSHLRTDGAPDVPVQAQDPALALWRSVSDMVRAQNSGISDSQLHQREFIRMFLAREVSTAARYEVIVDAQSKEIIRLQEENARLRDKMFAGFAAQEQALSQSAERDLALVAASNRQQMLADTFRVVKELAPRLLEQFIGVREVKKEIGKLAPAELARLLPMIPQNLQPVIVKMHAEETARVVELEQALRGASNGSAAETPQQEKEAS